MIVVDTNVVSQLLRANGVPRVIDWMRDNFDALTIPTLAIAEIVYGIELVEDWDRRLQLTNALAIMKQRYEDKFVPFDMAAADAHGWLRARLRRTGVVLPAIDGQIAAIAISRNARLATNNTKDFVRTGLELIDPWQA